MVRLLSAACLLSLVACASVATAASSVDEAVRAAAHDALVSSGDLPADSRLEIEGIRPSAPAIYRKAKSLFRFELQSPEWRDGAVTALGVFRMPNGTREQCWLLLDVQVLVPTVVATRRLQARRVIAQGDVELIYKPRRARPMAATPDQVIGKIPRVTLVRGRPVDPALLQSKPVVFRGDEVQVTVRGKGFTVKADGEVLQKGGIGDRVGVRIRRSGTTIDAVVLGPGSVESRPR